MAQRFTFSTEQFLPYPVEIVFAFFANPQNLPPLMPRWQHARIDEAMFCAPPPRPEGTPRFAAPVAGSGSKLTITARALPGVPVRVPWFAEIQDFRWNEGFCDIQTKGPFRYWRHCHSVRAVDGGTQLRDEVQYELPVGPLSGLANAVFAKHAMAATFRYRQKRTLELLARALPQ